jgi:hypothetical protein
MPVKFHTLRQEQWLQRPIGKVFAFFADARFLEQITPPWLNFRILFLVVLSMYKDPAHTNCGTTPTGLNRTELGLR